MSAPFPPDGVKVLSIGEVTRAIKGLLEEAFACVWVAGEVSNLKRHTSGHWYLTLKDSESQLQTVIYRGINMRLKYDLHDGMDVIARGRLGVYAPRGEYQLLVEEVQPRGIGPLELAFRQLKDRLSHKGWFRPDRKKPLPPFPRRVALITSPTGAAVRDMLETLSRRWPLMEVWVCPVTVQGDGAAQSIAQAVARLNTFGGLDILVLGRGGGSLEDLWPFNEECVAEAIHKSRIPVVTGIGHETDLVIADLVADLRALTPTDAATRISPDRHKIIDLLQQTETRLRGFVEGKVELLLNRVKELGQRRCFRQPLQGVRDLERRVDDWEERLARALRQHVARQQRHLEGLTARMETLLPNVPALDRRIDDWGDRLARAARQNLAQRKQHLDALAARLEPLLPNVPERDRQILDWHDRLARAARQGLGRRRQSLEGLAARLEPLLPDLAGLGHRLDTLAGRLQRAGRQRLLLKEQRLQALAARLETLSPLNVLARGYSLTRREADQAVVRTPAQLAPGDRLVTLVQHGHIVSRVEETRTN